MPIHLRAEEGDYAEAVLVPGDPLRAQYIAETFFDSPRQVNGERGMLGYTGTWKGTPVSVQASGMGCPSAAIVYEELAMLGARRLIRVGTCGGLQPGMTMGELVVATCATPADQTVFNYTGGEPYSPAAAFDLVYSAVSHARQIGRHVRVGGIVSSDAFYQPDTTRPERWSERGILAVEMEAAVLFTVGALRGMKAAALCTVSDVIVEGEFHRITDEDLRRAVDEMTEVALEVAIDQSLGSYVADAPIAAGTTAG